MRIAAVAAAAALAACAAQPPPPSVPWPAPRDAVSREPLGADAETGRILAEHPLDASVYPDAGPVLVSGWALPPGVRRPRRDVILVVDVSGSTAAPVEGGTVRPRFFRRPAPEGSILAVELDSVRALLRNLDRQISRFGIVVFSGGSDPPLLPGQRQVAPSRRPSSVGPDEAVRTALPLGGSPAEAKAALEEIAEDGPWSMTDMAAGLRRATAELVGGPGAVSRLDPGAEKLIVFLTDGQPTLPYTEPTRNELAVVGEIRRAASYGIRIHSFGVGREALEGPFVLVEMADLTGGTFTPVMDPRDLPRAVGTLQLAGVRALRVRNETSGLPALAAELYPDGRFDALVKLVPGRNAIRIEVDFADGSSAAAGLTLVRQAGAEAPAVPDFLVRRRGALLDHTALELRERRRIELLGRIREDMERARERADSRRRELELEAESAPAAAP